jgi:hypothetical protein
LNLELPDYEQETHYVHSPTLTFPPARDLRTNSEPIQ